MDTSVQNYAVPPVEVLPYAIAAKGSRNRLVAVAMMLVSALAMIALGGCFLIGVLLTFHPEISFGAQTITHSARLLSTGEMCFVGVLYLAAAINFFGAAFMILLAVRGILRIVEANGE